MFPPHAGPPTLPDRTPELGDWARLEAKSATTEADLLRMAERAPLGLGYGLGPAAESLVAWLLTLFDA